MATLLIWNNKYYGSHAYPGHASFSIDNNWTEPGQGRSYVSWWPDDGERMKPGSGPHLNVAMDLKAEGYAPDHIIEVYNLNEQRMLAKWKEIRQDRHANYRFLRSNCSTIVASVLKRGTGRGSVMERNNLVWTPLKVRRLALAIGGQEVTWVEFLGTLKMSGYLTATDVMVLKNLYRRDERHGNTNATGNSFYYSGGRQVNPKQFLIVKGQGIGSPKPNMEAIWSFEGSHISKGKVTAVDEDTGTPEFRWFY